MWIPVAKRLGKENLGRVRAPPAACYSEIHPVGPVNEASSSQPQPDDAETAPDEAEDDRPDSDFTVQIDRYEGPLDLLLDLIRKHKLDIFDIPIASNHRPIS